MSTHDKTCQKIMNRDRLRPFRSDRVTDRQTLINICIHCSDLSAQALPWISASRWEERISQEFDAQAKKEMKLGMTPSPMMMNLNDRGYHGTVSRVIFLKFVKASCDVFDLVKVEGLFRIIRELLVANSGEQEIKQKIQIQGFEF